MADELNNTKPSPPEASSYPPPWLPDVFSNILSSSFIRKGAAAAAGSCTNLSSSFLIPTSTFLIWAFVSLCLALALGVESVEKPWKVWVDPVLSRELIFIMALLTLLVMRSREAGSNSTVYLMDISCFRPPAILRAPHSTFLEHSKVSGIFSQESLEFQQKILERCGLGPSTSFPMCFRNLPPEPSMVASREEAEMVLGTCMAELLAKTKICTKDIGILVVNCSTFNPTPCLSSMMVNKFKLRSNIRTYNLGGMGCSAGVIAIDLAKDALQVHKATYAIVLSTENITQNWYWGNNKTMLVSNCLFRVGGAAILLSNKRSDKRSAKYRLDHLVRTHMGSNDAAYHAAYHQEDEEGKVGVFLSKDLMRIASDTLRMNTKRLGPLVLPYSEQLLFLASYLMRNVFYKSRGANVVVPPYVPDFRKAFDHFCIHSGGRAVLSAVEKGLSLSALDMEPSRMALHRFGNTSVSTTWYQFQYLECKGRVRRGDKVWQIVFGSGFKCNSAVWTALRDVDPYEDTNAWTDTILDYPVPLADFQEL